MAGLTGLQGPVGLSGPAGPQGPQGPPGRDGSVSRTDSRLRAYDANNVLVGDVIGVHELNSVRSPYVSIESNGQSVALVVHKNTLIGFAPSLYFASRDCTGQPLLPLEGDDWHEDSQGLFTKSSVIGVQGGVLLYLEDQSGGPIRTMWNSFWIWGECHLLSPADAWSFPTLPPIYLAVTPPFHVHRDR